MRICGCPDDFSFQNVSAREIELSDVLLLSDTVQADEIQGPYYARLLELPGSMLPHRLIIVCPFQVDYDIRVQMLEIYNEVLRDLLTQDTTKKNRLDIMSTEKSGENVPDATQMSVECTEDVLNFMEIGAKNRAVGSTKMNQRSSRSHSVLTVIVGGNNRVTGVRTHACLHLVDLAGSERVARSEASGKMQGPT